MCVIYKISNEVKKKKEKSKKQKAKIYISIIFILIIIITYLTRRIFNLISYRHNNNFHK